MIETEIKLTIESTERLDDILSEDLSSETPVRILQDDTLYDTPDRNLTRQKKMLRLRYEKTAMSEEQPKIILTYKGPPEKSDHFKVREEIEFSLDDREKADYMLQQLGFEPIFRYQKYRTTYTLQNLHLAVDETPIGTFLELEGTEDAISRIATKLQYTKKQYITANYYDLWQNYRSKNGIDQKDMLFD